MWNKLFYGASRLFANDVSSIVANEMKKKGTQQGKQQVFEENSREKERATCLNRLKQILHMQKEEINSLFEIVGTFIDIRNQVALDYEEIKKSLAMIHMLKDSQKEIYQELDIMIEIGERQGEITQDYAVKFKSKEVRKIQGKKKTLIIYVEDMVKCFEDTTNFELKLDKIANNFINRYKILEKEVEENYEEITNMNIVRIYNNGMTQTIDYND